jgi:flavin reductase (DIM6/NTAB) family NADH-FMN oxidoreductase RutF
MDRRDIPPGDLLVPATRVWARQWLLLACGDFSRHDFNCMTVGWGSLGVMWGKPFAMVVVRPTRYTFQFMERFPTFTLSAFPPAWKKALDYCGSHSGRDGDKVKACGLTAGAGRSVESPGFAEAELVIECRTIYKDDFDPAQFLDGSIDANYALKDYHRVYFGQIVAVSGTDAWRRKE